MKRLFEDEKHEIAAQEVVSRDIEIRMELLFKKYNYIQPMDLIALIMKILFKRHA